MAGLSFLSDGWLEALGEAGAALRVQSGVDGVVRFVVTATPHGKVQFRLVITDGRVVELLPGRDGEAEATVTWRYSGAGSGPRCSGTWLPEVIPELAFSRLSGPPGGPSNSPG